jgi:hypothetical protein
MEVGAFITVWAWTPKLGSGPGSVNTRRECIKVLMWGRDRDEGAGFPLKHSGVMVTSSQNQVCSYL